MFVGPVGRLSSNNAAFNWMNASNSLMGLCSFGGNTDRLRRAELGLTLGMLNDSLNYKAGILQEESARKLSKENIKRTFSTFA